MVRCVRFLVGLAMVVVGVALSAPMVTRVVDVLLVGPSAGADGEQPFGNAGPAVWAGAPDGPRGSTERVSEAGAPVGAGAYCIPDAMRADSTAGPGLPVPSAEPPGVDPALAVGAGEGEGHLPPPPPAPLPASPADLTLAPPAFPSTYRSTLDVPPPPLLDVDAPSPLVMPVPPSDARPASVAGLEDGTVNAVRATPVAYVAPAAGTAVPAPATAVADRGAAAAGAWVVRDGDDLTNIATRLYGHPGAAEAIWNANRDRIVDPALLPIGTALRVPAAWTPPQARGAVGPATLEPARRPGSVRVGPGETLESLALRFYGDRAWADRLWDANRDRLRNPALVVPGMELRLP